MKQQNARGKCWALRCGIRCALLVSIVFLTGAGQENVRQARRESDYIIVEHAQRLVVYNRYQQAASDVERSVFTRFLPMRILEADDRLSDGFTRCMKVEVAGRLFYLLKDSGGALTGAGPLGSRQTLRNATDLNDTLEILTPRSIRFTPINAKAAFLPPNQQIIRVFRHQGRTYGRTVIPSASYGWIDLAGTKEGRDWKISGGLPAAGGPIPPAVVEKVRTRTGEVNRLLEQLFNHFNEKTNQRRPIPRWSVEASDTSIQCLLQHTDQPGDFRESTIYLVRDLENIVLGTNLRVTYIPGRIDIARSGQ